MARDSTAPSVLQLVQSNSLPALVQVEIEQLILRGELAVGRHVNESELAVRFGTSRGPIREALRALEESRLVRSEKNRGRVRPRDIRRRSGRDLRHPRSAWTN